MEDATTRARIYDCFKPLCAGKIWLRPVEYLTGDSFYFYVQACGALLGRAHACAGDAAAIAGYCGKSPVLDKALVAWAEAYGDQTERDHARLVQAIKSGRVHAIQGV